jgi:hypothetical protein
MTLVTQTELAETWFDGLILYKKLQRKCKIEKIMFIKLISSANWEKTTITQFRWWNASLQLPEHWCSVGEYFGSMVMAIL